MNQRSTPTNKFIYLTFVIAIVAIFTNITSAQSETATVLGSIRDANDAAVVGAKVEIRNTATSIAATTMTDANGDYQFVNLKIGLERINLPPKRIALDFNIHQFEQGLVRGGHAADK